MKHLSIISTTSLFFFFLLISCKKESITEPQLRNVDNINIISKIPENKSIITENTLGHIDYSKYQKLLNEIKSNGYVINGDFDDFKNILLQLKLKSNFNYTEKDINLAKKISTNLEFSTKNINTLHILNNVVNSLYKNGYIEDITKRFLINQLTKDNFINLSTLHVNIHSYIKTTELSKKDLNFLLNYDSYITYFNTIGYGKSPTCNILGGAIGGLFGMLTTGISGGNVWAGYFVGVYAGAVISDVCENY
jgi:hypothetical protein